MTASPIWDPSGLSSTRHSSIFDLSHPRDGAHPDGRVSELNKFSINMDHHNVRQLLGTTYLPPFYGAIGLRRSPPSSFAGLPTIIPSVIGCRFPLPHSKNSHPDYPALARQSLFSPLDTSYYCSPVAPGPLPNHSMRPFQPPSLTSPASPQMPMYLNSTYASSLPKRSKAALAVEDWDHPSFARPPHRAFETLVKNENDHCQPVDHSTDINRVQHTPITIDANQAAGDEPLVPSLYPVPPPPPYEQSAAPLSDLAADIVWQRCYFSKTQSSASIGLAHRPWESVLPWSPSHGYHSTNGYFNQSSDFADSSIPWSGSASTYGVIGAEAKARRFNRQYCTSVSPSILGNSNGSNHCRKLSSGTKMEVKPAFRRWTRQVLEQTLLSPQVLILALYYIDCVVSMDVFGDGNGKLSLLPYKMLLSALVVANKTLDDHSYRNSTFANVSSMTNTEVNAIEVALLSALNFNVVPTSDQWTSWLKDVINTGERLGFHDTHLCLHSVSSHHLSQQAANDSPQHLGARSARRGSIFDQTPTPDYVWHSNSASLMNVFDHKKLSSSAPSDMPQFDFPTQHIPVDFQFSRDYAGSNTCGDFIPHHGNYLKRSFPHYS